MVGAEGLTNFGEGRPVVCRLLGYVAERPTSVVEVLGEEGFDAFTSLTAVHADGWGMAWHDPAEPMTARCALSPDSAVRDPTYVNLAHRRLGPAGLVHLRWATGGLPVAARNTHPFVEGGYAFAHNGHVAPLDRLEGLLTADSRNRIQGDTDSERYFRFLLQSIEETAGDEQEGVTQALRTLRAEFPKSSLNALLLTPSRMFAVHINSRAIAPPPALREMFSSGEDIPTGHDEDYFAMDYRVERDAVHVISSGLDESGWLPVPGDLAVMVDLRTRERTSLDLT